MLLEVTSFRTPCNVFKAWMGRSGYDDRAWVKRFAQEGRPGPYLRVLQPGLLAAGDAIEVVHRPGTGVTVSSAFREVFGLRVRPASQAVLTRAGAFVRGRPTGE